MKRAFGWIILTLLAVAMSFGGAQIPKQQVQKQPLFRPDLVVTGIDFQKVKSGTDSQGKTYWIFNVTAKVKNQGNGNAGAFKVLLERNNGAGGAWQTACQTCTIDVPNGLAAGQEMTTDPRQFNNANGMASKFKFTADSAGQVGESNEGNNSREEAFTALTVAEIPGGVPHLAKPDLVAESISFQFVSQAVVNGKTIRTFKVAAKVKNLGPGSSPACELDFDRALDWHVTILFGQSNKPVPPLGPNAEAVILSDDITHEIGTQGYYYNFTVDARNAVAETNEQNNNYYNNGAPPGGIQATLYPPNAPTGAASPRPRSR
jgi:hypothetical protein